MRKKINGYIVILLITLATMSTSYADEITDYQQARLSFEQALDDQDGALERAITQFGSLLENHVDNPVYQSYLGACTTLQGRDAWMPWNKMRYAEYGLDKIDKVLSILKYQHISTSLQGVSPYLETMLVAANTFIYVPDRVFHRRSKGKRLLSSIVSHPDYAAMPDDFKSAVQQALHKLQKEDF